MQHNMVNEDKEPTNLLKYAEQCKQVYQKLKKILRLIAASKQYKEKRIATNLGLITFLARKTTTSTTTTRTMSFTNPVSWQLTISEWNKLIKKENVSHAKKQVTRPPNPQKNRSQ